MFFDKGEVDGWGATWETKWIQLNISFIFIFLGFSFGKITDSYDQSASFWTDFRKQVFSGKMYLVGGCCPHHTYH
jgi:hypothetical protein